ncbi:hypothetical protein GLOIN_2v1561666 [Rhizophagus irregularis DAOM 181602=DAOM 197198]|uniref:Secreted protein n=1 Tax=Rhizophagus irregularis (strain DAOM 181602 / DAOM 197198 / MUCL 43194) TaxID=747089 RepID=A0A2P4QDK9_RHIID|nr:hypothetical protein GLOIN_2v1561666 [Rhizophagus irregularis DAOM 181602=DAOM 197198]POG75720.1 hypothetical protein GLOIN_2v1561666 [Rhizophagus irregularis DAOM 181602=DAOM 197198]GET67387.1 hypothetical protein GLOIN_2v1561666 [Rhizophagus irregularis DAOM 181602=DAOM 197198]|eukprot:XP_025182586.1 hypothetical protein GLOIN_2v1561666 [Rhizophagus irregularis DAOM 181602=DAOM 197198]
MLCLCYVYVMFMLCVMSWSCHGHVHKIMDSTNNQLLLYWSKSHENGPIIENRLIHMIMVQSFKFVRPYNLSFLIAFIIYF